MTLRSFCLVDAKENMKRRLWTLLLCAIAMFLALPVATGMLVSSEKKRIMEHPEFLYEQMSMEEWISERFVDTVTHSPLLIALTIVFAVLLAVQGFSWMNSRRKLDLYLSVPVSSRKRFLYVYLNGVGIFASCYLISLLAVLLTGAALWHVTGVQIVRILLYFLCNMLFFLAVYHLTLIAVMLTGHVLVTLPAAGVLFFYEQVIRMLYDLLREEFFVTYCSQMSNVGGNNLTSPIILWLFQEDSLLYLLQGYGSFRREFFGLMAMLAVQAVVYGAFAYLLYRKRGAEAAGNAAAFPACRNPIRLLLMIPVTLFCGMWFRSMSMDSAGYTLVGMIVGLLVSHGLIQVIYDFDMRSILRGKWQLFAAGGICAVIYACFAFDLMGYDSFLPDTDEVESVSVSFRNDYYGFHAYTNLFTDESEYEEMRIWMLDHMNDSSDEAIEAVRRLAADGRGNEAAYGEETVPLLLKYTLKSGREAYRSILVDREQAREPLDALYASQGFQSARYQIMDDAFLQYEDELELAYTNGMENINYMGERGALIRALRQDLAEHTFSQVLEEMPVGAMVITYHKEDDSESYYYGWTYPLYPGFDRTLSLLGAQEDDMLPNEEGSFLDPGQILSITITCHNLMDGDVEYNSSGGTSVVYSPERERTETFVDPADIAAIVPALYPEGLADMAEGGVNRRMKNENYEVKITFQPGTVYRNRNLSFVPLEEKLPSFAAERTRYRE